MNEVSLDKTLTAICNSKFDERLEAFQKLEEILNATLNETVNLLVWDAFSSFTSIVAVDSISFNLKLWLQLCERIRGFLQRHLSNKEMMLVCSQQFSKKLLEMKKKESGEVELECEDDDTALSSNNIKNGFVLECYSELIFLHSLLHAALMTFPVNLYYQHLTTYVELCQSWLLRKGSLYFGISSPGFSISAETFAHLSHDTDSGIDKRTWSLLDDLLMTLLMSFQEQATVFERFSKERQLEQPTPMTLANEPQLKRIRCEYQRYLLDIMAKLVECIPFGYAAAHLLPCGNKKRLLLSLQESTFLKSVGRWNPLKEYLEQQLETIVRVFQCPFDFFTSSKNSSSLGVIGFLGYMCHIEYSSTTFMPQVYYPLWKLQHILYPAIECIRNSFKSYNGLDIAHFSLQHILRQCPMNSLEPSFFCRFMFIQGCDHMGDNRICHESVWNILQIFANGALTQLDPHLRSLCMSSCEIVLTRLKEEHQCHFFIRLFQQSSYLNIKGWLMYTLRKWTVEAFRKNRTSLLIHSVFVRDEIIPLLLSTTNTLATQIPQYPALHLDILNYLLLLFRHFKNLEIELVSPETIQSIKLKYVVPLRHALKVISTSDDAQLDVLLFTLDLVEEQLLIMEQEG